VSEITWAISEPAANGELTARQIEGWREQGFTLVHDLLPENLLHQAAADAYDAFPAPGSAASRSITNFGSDQHFVFPSVSDACNRITLHPKLLGAVAALLSVDIGELRLTQSDVWVKYGRTAADSDYDNADQRIHCDYPNHMLTHPPPWDSPEAVEIIIYFADVADCEGSTAVVPRKGPQDPAYPWPITQTPGVGAIPYINDRSRAEAYLQQHDPAAAAFRAEHLYARERLAQYRFGSVLFYRHDTWHRGTPLKLGTRRVVHNLTFRKATSEWINVLHPGLSWSMYRHDQSMERLVAAASVEQRAVLGFPLPGSPYWNDATVEAVAQRYAPFDIDMEPYRRATI
jgi:hypothetical protein